LDYRAACGPILERHDVRVVEYGIWCWPELFSVTMTAEGGDARDRLSRAVDEMLMLTRDRGGWTGYAPGVGARPPTLWGGGRGGGWGAWGGPRLFSGTMTGEGGDARGRLACGGGGNAMVPGGLGGSIEYCHGVGVRLAHLMEREHGGGLEVMRALKSALDPQ